MQIARGFTLTSVSGRIDPLGPLALLVGTWKGTGFNQIWRPFHGSQDRFLELNETVETIEFTQIPGDIPNRGFLQPDINLRGLAYLQQTQDAHVVGPNGSDLAGIHFEPGIWLNVPATSDPPDQPTIARLANIPHGAAFVAQGSSLLISGPPTFQPVSITPFTIGQPANTMPFPEQNLAAPSNFRTPAQDIPNVTQTMLDDPNTALAQGIANKTVVSATVLTVSTTELAATAAGGGAANIAFLAGTANGPNAMVAQIDASFWIETIRNADGSAAFQLQYSQRVLLNFNGLSWPHVSAATLVKQ